MGAVKREVQIQREKLIVTANETLLSRIARRHTIGREDVATDALAFILERSPAVRSAFANFLGAGEPEAPAIAKVQTQYSLPNGAAPDLACLGEDGKLLALVESKFWAPLTSNQPVTYWEALPADSHSTLLFIAPAERIDPGKLWLSKLWDELEERLNQAGHELASPQKTEYAISAPAKSGSNRRLMVTSWETLLDCLAQSALEHRDSQASFEIAELQGLANSVIAGSKPGRYGDLNSLVTDTVNRMVQAGWANTNGLSVGMGNGYWVRYLRLAGAYARFGIYYDEAKRSNRPLWLAFGNFGGGDPGQVTTEEVRQRLASISSGEPIGFAGFYLPIDLLPGGDSEAAFSSIIAQLTDIARLIDPHIPTYHRDSARAEQP